MPKAYEALLRKSADKKGLKGKRSDVYIFGGLRRIGWKPKRE